MIAARGGSPSQSCIIAVSASGMKSAALKPAISTTNTKPNAKPRIPSFSPSRTAPRIISDTAMVAMPNAISSPEILPAPPGRNADAYAVTTAIVEITRNGRARRLIIASPVQSVELGRVFLEHRGPPYLVSRCELALCNRQLAVDQHEPAYTFGTRQCRVYVVDRFLYFGDNERMRHEFAIHFFESLTAGPVFDDFTAERDQCRDELPTLGVEDRLGNPRVARQA